MKALVIVDVQNDFLPGGALGVLNGFEVIEPIVKLAWDIDTRVVITTQDWHPHDSPHFDRWPRHCVRGTDGADLHPDIEKLNANYAIKKGVVDEDGYSGFDGETNEGDSLDEVLTFEEIDEVVIVGLALDYCVKATALDATKRGYETTVVLAATRPVDPEATEDALRELRGAGVEIA